MRLWLNCSIMALEKWLIVFIQGNEYLRGKIRLVLSRIYTICWRHHLDKNRFHWSIVSFGFSQTYPSCCTRQYSSDTLALYKSPTYLLWTKLVQSSIFTSHLCNLTNCDQLSNSYNNATCLTAISKWIIRSRMCSDLNTLNKHIHW